MHLLFIKVFEKYPAKNSYLNLKHERTYFKIYYFNGNMEEKSNFFLILQLIKAEVFCIN